MSAAADSPGTAEKAAADLPPSWERLEEAVEATCAALVSWRARALQAESEIERLRHALEETAAELDSSQDPRAQLRRIRAENAALRSRMTQAQRRVGALLAWTDALEPMP